MNNEQEPGFAAAKVEPDDSVSPESSTNQLQIEDSLRSPGSAEWKALHGDDDQAKGSRSELNQVLLASLQMQHILVLAGSGCSCCAGGPTMKNLWDEIVGVEPSDDAQVVAKHVGYDLSHKNIEAFLSQLEAGILVLSHIAELESFLSAAKAKILNKCTSFLDNDKLHAHRTFLHRVSRRRSRDFRLKVFTTNYDLCFERAAGLNGNVAIDGFSFCHPRRYDARFFEYDIVRRGRSSENPGNYLEGVFLLFKLHGSVNWEIRDGQVVENSEPSPNQACLIYPASAKYQQSYSQPYIESISQYLSSIRQPNTCVVSAGFGFNDDHLSEPLVSAVETNPHIRLVIVDPQVKHLLSTGTANQHLTKLAELSATGSDVWMLNLTFDAFATTIPDLKSLSPAEQLYQTVQNAMGAK